MKLSARQKEYRAYLLTEHWRDLRAQALKRDGWKCAHCHGVGPFNVHHTCYRGRYQDTRLEDLITLCRDCHRTEHGVGPSKTEIRYWVIVNKLRKMQRPAPADWMNYLELRPKYDCEIEEFADLMFDYILTVLAIGTRSESMKLSPDERDHKEMVWRGRAYRVKQSINRRKAHQE